MPRTFLPRKTKEETLALQGSPLPTHLPVVLYYRQSSMQQVGNISTFMQTVDMPLFLQNAGWSEDQIILIDADAGVSGTKRIQERAGLSQAFDLILNDQIGAIAAQDEDRFFRDASMIQANIFIEACREHHVMVITTGTIYDFAHPMYGQFHIKQFRARCESAADYIIHHIRGRLAKARMRRRMEGLWPGGFMPTGYMVELSTRKFHVFEPYAEIVRHYYDRALALNGNTSRLANEVASKGPWYPKVAAPPGFKTQYQLDAYYRNGGYNRRAWDEFLINPVYIGHWMVKGVVQIQNNHPAIVDEEVFNRVFDLISRTSLDGSKNKNYKERRTYTPRNTTRERPLLDGQLWTTEDGEWRQVGCDWDERPTAHWDYCLRDRKTTILLWRRSARQIDEAVETMVVDKLRSTFEEREWEKAVRDYWKQFERYKKVIEAEIAGINETMESLLLSLSLVKNPQMVADVERRYGEALALKEAKEKELEAEAGKARGVQDMQRIKDDFGPAVDNWPNLTRDRKSAVMDAFISYIHIEPEGYDTSLRIVWRDGGEDTTLVKRIWGEHTWTQEEEEILRQLINEDQLVIAAALPHVPWRRIYSKAYYMGVKLVGGQMGFEESYNEYCERMGIETYTHTTRTSTSSQKLLPLSLIGLFSRLSGTESERDGLIHFQVFEGDALRAVA